MTIQDLKNNTARSLDRAGYDPKKLALIHSGAALALSLVVTVLQFVLDRGIANTGGLSGIGLRTFLSTIQMTLSVSIMLLMPFWNAGFSYSALRISQGNEAAPNSLFAGFRRFLPLMRLFLLQMLLYFAITLLCNNLASTLYLLTPFSDGLMEILEPMMDDPEALVAALSEGALTQQLLPHLIGMYVITGILLAILGIPMFYRLRMAVFAMMDQPRIGALMAFGISGQLMRRHRFRLFRLDLHFWWFYLAQLLLSVIGCLDILLPVLGISLPFQADVSFFLFYVIYLGLQLVLSWQVSTRVQTTYAHFYLDRKAQFVQPADNK